MAQNRKQKSALNPAELIERLQNKDDAVRGPAWQGADRYGAPAVKPLVDLMANTDMETARCARRALGRIVSRAGSDRSGKTAGVLEKELLGALSGRPAAIQREILWWLSEIGGAAAVAPVAALLKDNGMREDARCVLMRLPADEAAAALKQALAGADGDFAPALADSLRKLGQPVDGHPTRKLTPVKSTSVQ